MKYVCNHCVHDDVLSALILEEGEERVCDYCGVKPSKKHTRSLSIRELADQIHERILWEYSDVDSEMISYDTEEGEYTCPTYTTAELLQDQIGLEVREAVLNDIDAELPDLTWCKKRFGSGDIRFALEMGWAAFVETARHGMELSSSQAEPESFDSEAFPSPEAFGVPYDLEEGVPPERILDALGDIVKRANLLASVDTGKMLFRARVHSPDQHFATVEELGPPSAEKALQSNRMSPAGTVMFYAALDRETAILETFQCGREGASEKVVSMAQFRVNRPLRVLDLTNLPQPPSFFGDFEMHHGIGFLWEFERDFTKPVARDGMEHMEYMPTQMVTAYFRRNFKEEGDTRVLFFDGTDCGTTTTARFQLFESKTERIPGSELIKRLS